MQKLCFIIFLLPHLCLTISAQSTFPTYGDVYYYENVKSIKIKTIPARGNVEFWDYAFLESAFALTLKASKVSNKNKKVPPLSNLALNDNFGNTWFYQTGKKAFNYLGYSGDDPLDLGFKTDFSFSKGIPENYNTLKLGSTVNYARSITLNYDAANLSESVKTALPFLPDSLKISIDINRSIKVDGQGKLFVPGQTYDKVLRINKIESYQYNYKIKSNNSEWIDITSFLNDKLQLPEEKQEVLFYTSSFTLPILKLYLDEFSREVISADVLIKQNAAHAKSLMGSTPQMSMYPNPAFTPNINIEFNGIPAGRYELKIYSLIGKLEINKSYYLNNYKFDQIDISALNPGVYIYALQNAAGKVLFSKRLTVVSP